jgi:3-deoxy-D-manno-octulosonic-acid transferase
VVTGNVKYDYPVGTDPEPKRIRREDIGLSREHTVIVAGCPRPEEEERAVLHACCEALRRHDHVRIIWAPRHLDRLPDVETMLRSAGLSFIRRARIEGSSPVSVPVILLDTLGELAAIYALADIAFVGATLVPLGGHNVMEPALFGVPVVFGPHTANVAAAAAALLETGGGVEVRDGYDLAKTWLRLIEEPERRRRMGQAASQAARTQDGALERTLDLIDRWVLDAGT